MKSEDIALAIISIVTLIVNLIPQLASAVPPEDSVIILSIGTILKAVLGDLKAEQPSATAGSASSASS